MIEAFQAKDIMTSERKIVMVDANGNDEGGNDIGGVYRDAISCLWQEFNDSSTLGKEIESHPLDTTFNPMSGQLLDEFLLRASWILAISLLCSVTRSL